MADWKFKIWYCSWWLKPCASWWEVYCKFFLSNIRINTYIYIYIHPKAGTNITSKVPSSIPSHIAKAGNFPNGPLQKGYALTVHHSKFPSKKKVHAAVSIPWLWSLQLVQSHFHRQRLPQMQRGKVKAKGNEQDSTEVPFAKGKVEVGRVGQKVTGPKLGCHSRVSFFCRTTSEPSWMRCCAGKMRAYATCNSRMSLGLVGGQTLNSRHFSG